METFGSPSSLDEPLGNFRTARSANDRFQPGTVSKFNCGTFVPRNIPPTVIYGAVSVATWTETVKMGKLYF